MSWQVAEEKAYYMGTWKDDAVTEAIIKEITTISSIEKGRKVKLKLTSDGFQITKSRLFQSRILFDYIPLKDIYFMTTNQHQPTSLLCIVKDPDHKYMIVAFRMTSPVAVGHFVTTFRSLKRAMGSGDNVEFRKKDNGNWTLRDRSNANARRELQQLFNNSDGSAEPTPTQVNGGIFYKKGEKRTETTKKPTIYDETPYVPAPSSTTSTYTTTFHSGSDSVDGHVQGGQIHNIGGSKVISRDDDTESIISNVSSMKSEIDALSAELAELKHLLEKSTGMSVQEHYRRNGMKGNNNNVSSAVNYNTQYKTQYVQPIVANGSDRGGVRVDVPDYRGYNYQNVRNSRTRSVISDGPEHLVARSYRNSQTIEDPDVSEAERDKRRYEIHSLQKKDTVDGDVSYPMDGYIYTNASERDADGSTVAYPSSTITTVSRRSSPPNYIEGKRTGTFKVRSGYGLVPHVVERPIEQIYTRPIIIRREYVGRRRPHSTYIVRSPEEDTYVYGSHIMKESF